MTAIADFNYVPSPTGVKFHESDAFVKLVDGPFGSGKTCMIMNDAKYYCLSQAPASDGVRYTRIGVVRGTYPELTSTTRNSILEVFPEKFGTVRSAGSPILGHYRFPVGDGPYDYLAEGRPWHEGDGTIADVEFALQALQTAQDAEKIKSANWTFAIINEATSVDYEVFTDDESHKVIYWTDGVTQKSMPFRSLKLPEWGIKSISLPSDFVVPEEGKEIYIASAEDDTDDYMRLAKEELLVDDSFGYPGAWSRRDEWSIFRVWRAEIDESFDFQTAYPEVIYDKIYPFIDAGAFAINRDIITTYKNPDGTIDYLLDCKNMGHWGNIKKTESGFEAPVHKMYQGYILVRPRGKVAHCICYATTDSSWKEMCAYIFNYSAVFTDVEDITEGFVCKKQK